MAKKKFYDAMESRRKSEMRDAGMLSDDKSAIANMPQNVRYHDWPGSYRGLDSYLNDDISGINNQMEMDDRGARKNLVPKKW
jgi:hypothetical protein